MSEYYDLKAEVENRCGFAVYTDAIITREWLYVLDVFFPDWPMIVGPPCPVFYVDELVNKRDGEKLDGCSWSDIPAILIAADAIRESRAACRGLLIHEAAHIMVEHAGYSPPDVHPSLYDIVSHGPVWRGMMDRAFLSAIDLDDLDVAEQIETDIMIAEEQWSGLEELAEELAA